MDTEAHTQAHASKITGYRELPADVIDLINRIKTHGNLTRDLIDELDRLNEVNLDAVADPRWLAIARTTLQTGQMQLVRAVAQPDDF